MDGKFLKNDQIILKYADWIKNNLELDSELRFNDIHIEEFSKAVAWTKPILIHHITELFTSILNRVENNDYTHMRYLALVFQLENQEADDLWVEATVEETEEGDTLKYIDFFTPPSLYILRNPLDLISYNCTDIKVFPSQSEIFSFEKSTSNSESISKTLNFVKDI